MIPRLKTSKKWTHFPKEYVEQIEEAFRQTFVDSLKNAQIVIEGRIYAEEILLRVGYLQQGRLVQANFEVSMGYNPQGSESIINSVHASIDAAASMMQDYIENEGVVDFPYSWKEYDFDNKKLYIQYSTVNTSLEAQADALLGSSMEDDDQLMLEQNESEDAMDHVDTLIESEEDSDEIDEDEIDFEDSDESEESEDDKEKKTLH